MKIMNRFPMPKSLEQRWLIRVNKNGPNGCWIWTGAKWSRGYGKFTMPKTQRRIPAHRWGYEHFVRLVPDGMELDHICRNPCCVNPDHLEPVTHLVNVQRGKAGEVNGNRQRNKTHCPRGHEYNDENTYHTSNGRRNCRPCGALVARHIRHQRMAA